MIHVASMLSPIAENQFKMFEVQADIYGFNATPRIILSKAMWVPQGFQIPPRNAI